MKNTYIIINLIITLFMTFIMADEQVIADGIYAAALTPMDSDLQCNSPELANHCKELLYKGCAGVVLFGTTGEGSSFSVEERLQALEQVITEGIQPEKIILGNGSSGISDTVALIQSASNLSCHVVLIAPPCYFKNVKEEGVVAFYREIIQKSSNPKLKVILYHIPQFTGVPITLNIIKALRNEFPDIVFGIKESEGKLEFSKTIIDAFPGFKVYVGKESQIIEAVRYGAAGSICGIANLYPELICSLFQLGKVENSQNPKQIEDFFKALNGYHFVAAFKAVMEKRHGSTWHTMRPPLVPLNEAEKSKFLSDLQNSGLEL